jgi:hypothetical protein
MTLSHLHMENLEGGSGDTNWGELVNLYHV